METIIEHGDVVVCVGQQPDQQKFLVSGAILCETSPVFKAILSSKYAEGSIIEGHATLATGQRQLTLLDDDPRAMRALLYYLQANLMEL